MELCTFAKQGRIQGVVSMWANREYLRHLCLAKWPCVCLFPHGTLVGYVAACGRQGRALPGDLSGVSSRISELALNIDLAGAASACAKLQNYSCWVICCVYLTISRTLPAAAVVRGTVGVLSPRCFCGGSRARLWAQVKVVLGMPDRSLLLSLGLASFCLIVIASQGVLSMLQMKKLNK